MNKKPSKRKIVIAGKAYDSLESASRAFSKSRNTVDYRLSKGWTPEQAVDLEPRPDHAKRTVGIPVVVQGRQFKSIREASKHYKRAYTYVIERLQDGCTIEEALGLVKRADTLQSEYPELAKQWHPIKNVPLTPEDVTYGSGNKVWWLCANGHVWQAVINSRHRGLGCPHCAGQRATADRNFTTEYPELLKEWDWEKNKNIQPEKLSPRTNKKVWWRCEKGHSWRATIVNRTRKYAKNLCPYCSNRKLGADNSLEQVRPDIAKDWHPTKNKSLSPKDVIAGGSRKVWWICKHGHEWKATVGSRVLRNTGCPKCALQTSRIEIAVYSEVHALFPNVTWQEKIEGYESDIFIRDKKIAIEVDGVYWHKRRPDAEVEKSKLFESLGIQLFRLREKGLPKLSKRDISFKWSDDTFPIISRLIIQILKYAELNNDERSRLSDYVEGSGLINEKMSRKIISNLPAPPVGESLAEKAPEVAEEWAYDLNAPLSPKHFWPQANRSVWWKCVDGHVWKTTINNRVNQKTGCPHCPRKVNVTITGDWNLADQYPNLAKEWHPEKNGGIHPEKVRPKSNKKYWWKCSKGHEWQATASSRASGHDCPYCSGRFASETSNFAYCHPELLKEWDAEKNKGLNPSDFTPHVGKKIWWKCKEGHSWQATIHNRTRNRSGCPICARNSSRKYSIEVFQNFAKAHGGECLTEEYKNCKTKIKFTCKEGHTFETRADNILYYNKWCSICAKT